MKKKKGGEGSKEGSNGHMTVGKGEAGGEGGFQTSNGHVTVGKGGREGRPTHVALGLPALSLSCPPALGSLGPSSIMPVD